MKKRIKEKLLGKNHERLLLFLLSPYNCSTATDLHVYNKKYEILNNNICFAPIFGLQKFVTFG